MPGPRFLLFSGVSRPDMPPDPKGSRAQWGDPGHGSPWTSWRLLGRNNRELGRSPEVLGSVTECVAAIEGLRRVLHSAARLLSTDDRDGRWCWRLSDDGVTIAVSARSYQRQRECIYSLEQFITAVGTAESPVLLRELPAGDRHVARQPPDDGSGQSPPGPARADERAGPGRGQPPAPAVAFRVTGHRPVTLRRLTGGAAAS